MEQYASFTFLQLASEVLRIKTLFSPSLSRTRCVAIDVFCFVSNVLSGGSAVSHWLSEGSNPILQHQENVSVTPNVFLFHIMAQLSGIKLASPNTCPSTS